MQKQKNMKYGAVGLFLLFVLLFFALVSRFLYIEITGQAGGEVLAAKMEKKYEKKRTIEAQRGSIVDRNGEVIAEDTASYSLIAILDKDASHVEDPEKTAAELSKYIDLTEAEIYKVLTKKTASGTPYQVEFGTAGRDLSNSVKLKIEKLKLPGITFIRDSKRFYPNGVFSSHLIGYVEKDPDTNETVGKLGIEKYLNEEMKETNGEVKFESDRWGLLLPNSKESVTAPKNGSKVSLTLDKKIQTFLEDSMSKVQEEYNPSEIIAIVSNPKTGEILAMGQRPTFHPKTKEGLTDTWHNLAIEESFEPGSTMKAFTLAAAVEEGVFNPTDTFVTGSYKVPGTTAIKDHSGIQPGKRITFLDGIQRSSNVGIATIAMDKLGADKYREYLTKFGFEKPTGIDLPFETAGIIQYKYKRDKASTAMGQATAITPIQQIQAASAIANDGKMMKPYVIKEITDGNTGKNTKTTKPTATGQPISAETAKKVREYLGTVITGKHATGKKYKIDGYEVAGKTGTAQYSEGGKIVRGASDYIYSFIGMAPKDDPELVMYVAIKQPQLKEGKAGADALSAIFNPVMKNSLQYLNIKPTNIKSQEAGKLEEYKGQHVSTVTASLKKAGNEPVLIGKGTTIVEQSPKAGTTLLEGEKVILRTDGDMIAPDMTGWSLRDVMKFANLAELQLNTAGSGYVSKQNIKVGKVIKKGEYCIVELKHPSQLTKQSKKQSDKKAEDEVSD